MLGSSVTPGDSFASDHVNARPSDDAELFSFFFFLLSWNSPRPDEDHPEHPNPLVLEPGVGQSQHRQLISAGEGRSPPPRCGVKGFGLFSHSSPLLAGGRVI